MAIEGKEYDEIHPHLQHQFGDRAFRGKAVSKSLIIHGKSLKMDKPCHWTIEGNF
jgi:hypothetical protein